MNKTDKSIHKICIASIKKSTCKPYDFKWTKFYESNEEFPYSGLSLYLKESELIICSTFIDNNNYSILTTKQFVTNQEGELYVGNLEGAIDKGYGDFKGYKSKEALSLGRIQLQNGNELNYFIETGYASMVMIHGVRAFLRTENMTIEQIEKVTRIWNRKTEQRDQ